MIRALRSRTGTRKETELNNEENNFFDARTIVAVILVGVTFVGWQTYMQKKYPQVNKSPVTEAATSVPGATEVKPEGVKIPVASSTKTEPSKATNAPEKITTFESENLSFDISSRGMGLKNVRVHKFKDRKGGTIVLGHPEEDALSFETRLLGRAESLPFTVEKVNDHLFVGRATLGCLRCCLRRWHAHVGADGLHHELADLQLAAAVVGDVDLLAGHDDAAGGVVEKLADDFDAHGGLLQQQGAFRSLLVVLVLR